jgi:putative FmdB family regulatory protein
MPIYEYRCNDCGHELEKMQKLSEAPLTDCPECGQPSLRKVISAVGFRLKGSGWYETDFKKGDKKKNLHADSDKGSEKGSGGGSESKADSGKSGEGGQSTEKGADKKPAEKKAGTDIKAA